MCKLEFHQNEGVRKVLYGGLSIRILLGFRGGRMEWVRRECIVVGGVFEGVNSSIHELL